MNTVFETKVYGKTYRHLHFHEYAEATIENLMGLVKELGRQLDAYNAGDFTRHQLKVEILKTFEGGNVVTLSYRVSKLVRGECK